jgi:hypothetical protein
LAENPVCDKQKAFAANKISAGTSETRLNQTKSRLRETTPVLEKQNPVRLKQVSSARNKISARLKTTLISAYFLCKAPSVIVQ